MRQDRPETAVGMREILLKSECTLQFGNRLDMLEVLRGSTKEKRLGHVPFGQSRIQFQSALAVKFGCKRPNVTSAASSGFDQPSMIALASNRTLDVAALVVEGLPTTRECSQTYSTRPTIRSLGPGRLTLDTSENPAAFIQLLYSSSL
jgi:hypothetical protein